MALEIRVVSNRHDLRRFIQLPFRLYQDNPYWIPPLLFDEYNTFRKDRNPAFEFCQAEYWLAWRDGKPVGRIAGIINQRYIEKWGKAHARFGWIEFVEDFAVAKALLETAENWARDRGMTAIIGPMGFTDLDKEGLLVEGFEELGTMGMIYNPAYYPAFIERLGYGKDVDWVEFQVKTPAAIPEKAMRVQELIGKRSGIHLLQWRKPRELVAHYGSQIFELLDEAYAGLYGTTPLSPRQVKAYIDQYLGFVDPRFTKVVVDEHQRLIAFGITFPSLSLALQRARGRVLPFGWIHLLKALRHPTGIDMYLVAVRREYQARGVLAFIMTALSASCIAAGVQVAETNAELESNHQVQSIWKDFERRQHKRRRAYKKPLCGSLLASV
jgi:GNAT superfamily N-acetyltransferase